MHSICVCRIILALAPSSCLCLCNGFTGHNKHILTISQLMVYMPDKGKQNKKDRSYEEQKTVWLAGIYIRTEENKTKFHKSFA
ncbi:hypothetical protein BDF14DRAFT_1748250 [Spinellus fusiger]|nr:hypothetical protein BDF14DRAFT_1748250 [Spinellus fusiger]